ncbi:NUDIX domain-containing protein [Streptomyces sp. NPDC059816]|uniref:NUDIX domain-containing protein n=1 Tax=Streptomyces sp. NPDC059816 TaxID=3346960 RepID=UPI00364AA204
MTDDPPSARVQLDGTGLALVRHVDEDATYSFPRRGPGRGRTPDGTPCVLPLAEALHARIRPLTTAETVLRDWATGRTPPGTVPWDDPTAGRPVRVRAGGIVIRDGRMLLIGFEEDGEPFYEIPGGGVEDGEEPPAAVVRELREETGLTVRVRREVARVWKDGRREHYFLLEAEGRIGPREELDNHGGTPTWIPLDELPTTALWPKRLGWRIAHWHATNWPARPAELADGIHDLRADCTW